MHRAAYASTPRCIPRSRRNRKSRSMSDAVDGASAPVSETAASTTEIQHCRRSAFAGVSSRRLTYGWSAVAKRSGSESETHSVGSTAQNACNPSANRAERGYRSSSRSEPFPSRSIAAAPSFPSAPSPPSSTSSCSSHRSMPSNTALHIFLANAAACSSSPAPPSPPAGPLAAARSSSDGNAIRRRMATIGNVGNRGNLATLARLTPLKTAQSTSTSCAARRSRTAPGSLF